jgi:oligoendopeptidase F
MDWDLTGYFANFEAYEAFVGELETDCKRLVTSLSSVPALSALSEGTWAGAVDRYEAILSRFSHASSYVGCLAAAEASVERHQQAESRMARVGSELSKLGLEFVRALRDVDDASFEAFAARPDIASARPAIVRWRREGAHTMAPELESLAADLGNDGLHAWGRLYNRVSSDLTFTMAWPDGRKETLPVAQRRSLMASPDRAVRLAAFEGGNEAWRRASDVCGAALNHIAGTRIVLDARRKRPSAIHAALEQAAISEATLESMMNAVQGAASVSRKVLALKAKAMGRTTVGWFDLEAPFEVGTAEAPIPWEDACARVTRAFHRASPELGAYFDHCVSRRWIDFAPRGGKRPGAFCTSSEVTDETRIFMTYQGTAGDVSTLAHEAGHAFHAEAMRGIRPLARQYPMTLAESASTFGELLLADSLRKEGAIDDATRARMLGESLGDAVAFLLDIPVRYTFERAFYEERKRGEVSVARISELMATAQRRVLGNVLEPGAEDPLFWASKLHFFLTDISFYNFPYTFGFLLSRALFQRYLEEGTAFMPKWVAFLRETGQADAHVVAARTLGEDLESEAFWRRAIASLEPDLAELEVLAPKVFAGAG